MKITTMGRPPLPAERRTGRLLGVRLTDDERDAVDAAAGAAGATVSDWARNVLLAAARGTATGDTKAMSTTDGVPPDARTTEIDGRTYWMEQTRSTPSPQVAVIDALTGEIQGYFYPIHRGFAHVSHQPYESGNAQQTQVVGEIARRFSYGI